MNCIHAGVVYTGNGIRRNTHLLFTAESIAGFSDARKGKLVGECAVLTPAFIDAHSHIGIHRHGEPAAEGEANDQMDSILALPDVLDSIQMDDAAFQAAMECGTLYSCVMPGSSNLISGLSAVIRHSAAHSTEALIGRAGIKAALGYNIMAARERKGTRPSTRMGALAVLRARLRDMQGKLRARRGARGKGRKDEVLKPEEEVLAGILQGRTRLRVHAHKIDDIAALLRLVDEFKLRVTVEHAMDVNRPEIFGELRRRGIPVTYGPVETFASKVELLHKNWRNVRHLLKSGVTFGLMTDHPVTPSWGLLQQTRFFLRAGLTKQQAIETLTRGNAEILGVSDRLGTLEKGKWASFLCWDGDPFDIAHHPAAVYAEGRCVCAD